MGGSSGRSGTLGPWGLLCSDGAGGPCLALGLSHRSRRVSAVLASAEPGMPGPSPVSSIVA